MQSVGFKRWAKPAIKQISRFHGGESFRLDRFDLGCWQTIDPHNYRGPAHVH